MSEGVSPGPFQIGPRALECPKNVPRESPECPEHLFDTLGTLSGHFLGLEGGSSAHANPPPVGGQNRVDLAFSRFFPSLKGFLGPKNGQNLGKIGSIWHIFPFLGPFVVLCLLAFGDTVSKC